MEFSAEIVNKRCIDCYTPTHNSVSVIELEKCKLSLDQAVIQGDDHVVERLIQDTRIDISFDHCKLLFNAVLYKRLNIFLMLIKNGRMNVGNYGWQLLLLAVTGSAEQIALYLVRDIRVDYTPILHILVEMCIEANYESIILSILSDPRVNYLLNEEEYIQCALDYNKPKIVSLFESRQLSKRYASIANQKPGLSIMGRQLCGLSNMKLLQLVEIQDIKSIQKYLNNNIVFIRDGHLALEYACISGRVECAKTILADPRIDPSVEDCAVLVRAAEFGQVQIVSLLLGHRKINPCVRIVGHF